MRRVVDGTATREDLGLHDAVNDVLQQLNLVKEKATYLQRITKSRSLAAQPLAERSIESPAKS